MTLAEQIKGLHDNTTLLASAIPSLPPVPVDFTVADLKAMVAENERMREALEWYVNVANWGHYLNDDRARLFRCKGDGYDIAREALGDKV